MIAIIKAHQLKFLFAIVFICTSQVGFAQHQHHSSSNQTLHEPLQDTVGSGSITLAAAIQSQESSLGSGHTIHSDDADKLQEHQVLLSMFPQASNTNVAVALNGGSWFDVNTWSTGEIPGNGRSVYIPHGISVIYDTVSNAKLDRVAVDGELHFSVTNNTRLIVDSLFTGPNSVFTIGDSHNPVPPSVKAEIMIHRNNGAVSLANDSTLLSKGIVSHGRVRIVGVDKTDHLKTLRAPQVGDDYLLLDHVPKNWEVGDKLVVAASNNWLSSTTHQIERYEDEVVTIAAIASQSGGTTTVELNQELQYDHRPPTHSSEAELKVSVANFSRNVFIGMQTSSAAYLNNGNTVPILERGHVMFMHSDDVLVKNAEFYELGRTDKSAFFSNTNVPGRYPLHFHRTGVNYLQHPAVAEGNAIWGSPGWGITHHDANVNVDSNAVFAVVGSGIVAEAGNETGRWDDNIVIQTTGIVRTFNAEQSSDSSGNAPVDHPAYQAEVLNNSFMQGEAYGMKSRLLEITNNIAASANGAGFSFWPHGTTGPSHIGASSKSYEEAQGYDPFYGQDSVYPGKVPTRDFHGNEVIASRHALNTSANKIAHRHDMDVIIEDLLAWNVDQPIMSFYQENYIVKDSVFIRGAGNTLPNQYYNGVGGGSTATHIHDPVDFKLINNYFEGFDTITKEPFQLILGNTVVGSSVSAETGPEGRFRQGATADNDSIDVLDNSNNWRQNSSFENTVGHLHAVVDLSESDLVMTETFDRFSVVLDKFDTLGAKQLELGSQVNKEFRGASQRTWWIENSVSDGYYNRNGKIYLIVEAVVGDRVTGTIGSLEAAIELRFLNGDASGLPDDAVDNGALPSRINDSFVGTFRIVDQRDIGQIGNLLDTEDSSSTDTNEPEIFGFGFGDSSNRESYSLTFNLPKVLDGATLCVTGHSINNIEEVSVSINGTFLAHLPVSINARETCFEISTDLLRNGNNVIVFTQSSPGEIWGVSRISFKPIGSAILAPVFMLLLDE